jgi:AcrR family transcriptional regulator
MSVTIKNDQHQRILQEATRLFVTRGYNGISMREIAEASGLSKPGIYYHFADKEDLFMAILSSSLDNIEEIIHQARLQGDTTREQVSCMMRAIFAWQPEQRAIIRLASEEMSNLSPAAQSRFSIIYRQKFLDLVEDMLQTGIEQGELREMDVHLATWMLMGMIYPFCYPAHEREVGSPDKMIDLLLKLYFEGANK